MTLRLATTADAACCLEIYRPAIEHSSTSFEIEVPSVTEFETRIARTLETHPWLVAVGADNSIAGYAYGGVHRARAAYQWSVETSAYVRAGCRRGGVGRALYEALFRCLRHQGFCNAFAGITLPNAQSVAFHQRMGFVEIGTFRDIGCKLGNWHGVRWVQKRLQHRDAATITAPVPLRACREELAALLLE